MIYATKSGKWQQFIVSWRSVCLRPLFGPRVLYYCVLITNIMPNRKTLYFCNWKGWRWSIRTYERVCQLKSGQKPWKIVGYTRITIPMLSSLYNSVVNIIHMGLCFLIHFFMLYCKLFTNIHIQLSFFFLPTQHFGRTWQWTKFKNIYDF